MRYYGADDLIALPKLGTTAAVALGQELLTAAKVKSSLPPQIVGRLNALQVAHTVLHQTLSMQKQTNPDAKRAQSADFAEDQAWSAFHDWLYGWTKLDSADADQARHMYAALFPNRLSFTKLPYKLEWAEADARLTRIAQDGMASAIEQLGGKRLLDHLSKTHVAYGEALRITAVGEGSRVSGLREPLDLFLTRLRAYVLAVAAHADEADPNTVALTESLLAPLRQWQSRTVAPTPDLPAPQPVTTAPEPATGPGVPV